MEIQHSSLTMQDSRVEIKLSPELFRNQPFRHMSDLHVEDQDASLILKKQKRNGDLEYELSLIDNTNWKWQRHTRITISLFAGSNDCFIRIFAMD